ncbi:MAG: hypothetical protein KF906_08115 [Actinobacteria bacterium]|nr:hypothetical protein [Actinomycetota bacterium]
MTAEEARLPIEELGRWLRTDPPAPVGFDPMSDERMAELTERAMAEGRRRRVTRVRRRRGLIVGVGIGVAAVSGTAVAALVERGPEPRPEVGVVCRAEPTADADAIVVPFGPDPVESCRARWADGSFGELGTEGRPDELTACVDDRGTIEVLPGPRDVCVGAGMTPLDPEATADPIVATRVELQDRIVEEINSIDCLTADEAAAAARRILDDLGLDDWPVSVNPDAIGARCAKAGIAADGDRVFVFRL